mmetsp:Transcript_24342/g.74333  ORF Transcript_24342/g.74333 Transcript_24342/m.74333 type:complete len:82 (+) Transcript_24342:1569-1814(+)
MPRIFSYLFTTATPAFDAGSSIFSYAGTHVLANQTLASTIPHIVPIATVEGCGARHHRMVLGWARRRRLLLTPSPIKSGAV